MSVKQIKVDVNEITVGMFVSGLDRPWTQTPFPLQGFYCERHIYFDFPVSSNGP